MSLRGSKEELVGEGHQSHSMPPLSTGHSLSRP
jgi:hypothetical protein